MQPATLRRLLVFGVCLVGVGCLYLVPSMAGAPRQVGGTPVRHDLPTAQPADVSPGSTVTTGRPTTGTGTAAPTTLGSPATFLHRGDAGADNDPTSVTAGHAATARAPGRDADAPSAVGRLSVRNVDAERLTVTWPAAADDVGVVRYTVWLNGFPVLTTQQTRATLTWFNDSSTHVIQVQALDGAGNEGPSSPVLLLERPAPSEATTPPTPSPSTPPTPSPTTSSRPGRTPPTPDTENADRHVPDTDTTSAPTVAGGTGDDGSGVAGS